ncbi:MAG: DUF3489 domain-containing protein [Sphingomonas sp.]
MRLRRRHRVTDASNSPKETKAALVLKMLQRDDGATLAELTAATNWLPHTTRAALTGLRKKGHSIDKGKRGDTTCYRIAMAA